MEEDAPTSELSSANSISRKVSDGNFGGAEAFISVSGISADTAAEEVEELLDTTKIVYDAMKGRLLQRVADLLKSKVR